MNKKKIIILGIFLLVVILGTVYWWTERQDISIPRAVRRVFGIEETLNIDNPEELFHVVPPEHFDDAQKERLGDKINLSMTLYGTKKDETWTWITIGNMYEFAEDYDRAIAAYVHAASLNESEYISRVNIAYIYEHYKEEYGKAEEYYKQVLELTPGNPDSYDALARLYDLKMNKPEEAEKMYLDGLVKTKNNPDLLVALIRFYQKYTNTEKVAEYSNILLKLYPDNEVYKRDFGEFVK